MNWSRQFGAKLAPLVLGCVGIAYALTAIAVARRSPDTSYVGESTRSAWWFAIAGLAMIIAGALTVPQRARVGTLSLLAGMLWFAPLWEGWISGPSLPRTLAMLAASFLFPLLAHLVLAAAGWPMRAAAATVVTSGYVIASSAIFLVAIRDPFLDPNCWANCTANALLVSSRPHLAENLVTTQLWLTAVIATAFTVVCVGQLAIALRSGRRRYWEVLPGGAVLGIATVAYTIVRRRVPLEDPHYTAYVAVLAGLCLAVVLIACGLGAALVRPTWQRRLLARLVTALGEAPPTGSLDAALADAVGDPALRIAYWLPDEARYVDASGHEVADPAEGRAASATPLVHDGETVAVVTHHVDPVELERSLGPAARLALDNERLQANVRARMLAVAASRARIVEAADARRRDLERNLHDGAQQSILGLSYDLQVARNAAVASGDGDLVVELDSALTEVRAAFHELRDLAHGIYPAVLTTAGLGPAVHSLADTYRESELSHLDVDVRCSLAERCPPSVEAAAYVVVASGLEAAHRSGADHAGVVVGRRDGLVEVEVTQSHDRDFPPMIDVADRVSVTGGQLVIDHSRLLAEIPCES